MGKGHIKRLATPRPLVLPRKIHPWIVRPSPGPHPKEFCIPLLVVLRDYLHLCDSAREGKRILRARKVLVDNRVITDHKFPVGFMDVISIPDMDRYYRVLFDPRGKFQLIDIDKEHSQWKLCRIKNKHYTKGGKIQITLHDSRNILVDPKDAKKYKVGDTLKISIPDQKILDHYPLKEGYIAMIISGRHAGQINVISGYKVTRGPMPNMVYFEGGISTIKECTFVVGKTRPEITLPEME